VAVCSVGACLWSLANFQAFFWKSDGRGRPSHIVARASPPALGRCEQRPSNGGRASVTCSWLACNGKNEIDRFEGITKSLAAS
jgi:hypothetical protein